MRTIELIDVEVSLPDDTVVDVKRRNAGQLLCGVVGRSVDLLRDRIEVAAIIRGFGLKRTSVGSHLVRRGQGIDVITTNAGHAVIRVDDPEALPDARVEGSIVALGPLSLDVCATQIIAGKERHEEDGAAWQGEWHVQGDRSARDLCGEIHRQLVERSQPSSVDPPIERGIDRWVLEASLAEGLVRVIVLGETGGLRLDVILVVRSRSL